MTLPHVATGQPHVAAHNDERDAINSLEGQVGSLSTDVSNLSSQVAGVTSQVALPVTGVKVIEQFIFTNPAIARPAVPSYVVLNWSGPAGTGGVAPTNMATGDTWDVEVA